MAAVLSPVAGTRVEPIDSYQFIRGTTATFKITFMNGDVPTKVDTSTIPKAYILEPMFLNKSGSPVPIILATLDGSLVPGQEFEYQFTWDIPANMTPLDEYVVMYDATIGSTFQNYGDEYFTITSGPAQVKIKTPAYATVSDVRMMKFNIDDYLPPSTRQSVTARDNIIEYHLRVATTKLREELALFQQRINSENYKLFCVYHAIYTILLSSRGEDGSSVSDQNLQFWKSEWGKVLDQEKRQGANLQGVPLGRG